MPLLFSSRVPELLEDNALARAVAVRRAAGLAICDLTLANPTQAGLDYPAAEIGAALAEGAAAAYAPQPRGLASARAAIAGYYRGRGPDGTDPDRLHLTSSTSEGYSLLFKLLGDSGAEVLAPQPSYPLIEHLAALEGWRVRPYPLVWDGAPDGDPRGAVSGWRVDYAALERAITQATRAIAYIQPHNPTGLITRNYDAHQLLDLCAAHGLALIVDEVFLDYAVDYGETMAQAATGPDRSKHRGTLAQSFAAHDVPTLNFTLGGLSKSCGMPHVKLGWIHTGGPAALAEAALARLDFIADTYLSVATPVQAATPKLLEIGGGIRAQIQARVNENFAALAAVTWPEGFTVLPREAGWSALLRRPGANDEERLARELLDRAGVLAHPGYFFDFAEPGWHVLSLLPEPAVFNAGLAALREWLPKLV